MKVKRPTEQERREFADAHALHDEVPREFCPECDRLKNRTPNPKRLPKPRPR